MRIRKDPEIRKKELLDAAVELFSSVGYEKTMVADIVKRAGVAKGTFFYYFPTKEAVLEAICMQWANEFATAFCLHTTNYSSLDKMNAFLFDLMQPSEIDNLLDQLWDGKQFEVFFKVWQKQVEEVFNPLLFAMIEEGNKEKTMRVIAIEASLAFFWSTLECLWEALYLKNPASMIENKIKIAEFMLEQLLGIEKGRIKIWRPKLIG
jgi:AcrR family transcriptional regulator